MGQQDVYPGHGRYGRIVQRMLTELRDGTIDLNWRNRQDVSINTLCRDLVARHFQVPAQGQVSNAAWLGCDQQASTIRAAAIRAVNNQQGLGNQYPWTNWAGTHYGHWHSPPQYSPGADTAIWEQPQSVPSRHGPRRTYSHQRVHWPAHRKWGWNQSHPDVRYVWGWDPKEAGQANGEHGSHVGFPFNVGRCYYILWVTPRTAFLEGINRGRQVTLTVEGTRRSGYPKTSAELPNASGAAGFGQWVVSTR